jgi:hypothetical protein
VTLQPDKQMWIDVGKLIRERVPDKNGKTLPADLTSGSYEFRDLTNIGVGTLFEGKVIYDKTYGHVAYGCGTCCGWYQPKFFYDPLLVPLGSTAGNSVTAMDQCIGKYDDVSFAFYGNWSSANTAIATVDYYGTHRGVSVGSTTSNTSGWLTHYGHWVCPDWNPTPSGGVNVPPSITVTLNFIGNKSGGDNLSFLKSGAECSESLGAKDCTSATGYWLWNLEGTGVVTDDASNWTVVVSLLSSHYNGFYRDSNNNLQPFSCSPPPNPTDGPRLDYLQQPGGQKTIFYIDGPGLFHGTNPSNPCQLGSSPVDSVTDVFNFQVTFTSKVSSVVSTTKYFVKIVVPPGGKLDFTKTIAGMGNI